MKLTKETIEVIEREFVADKANDRIVFDDKVKGFGLRLQGDTRTWIVQYRTNTGQRRFKSGIQDTIKRASKTTARIRSSKKAPD